MALADETSATSVDISATPSASTTSTPASAPVEPHPEFVVRSGTLLHNATPYVAGAPFWTDEPGVMDQLIRERTVILAVEAKGMTAVGQELAAKEAELAALRAELERLQSGGKGAAEEAPVARKSSAK